MTAEWRAEGILLEICNCELLCHARLHPREACDYDRCVGFLGIHAEDGGYDGISLADLNAFALMEAPRQVFDGGRWWMQAEGTFESTVEAIEGRDGSPLTLDSVRHPLHAPSQVLALASTRCACMGLATENRPAHALRSHLSWEGS
jgi:hypothetical protein